MNPPIEEMLRAFPGRLDLSGRQLFRADLEMLARSTKLRILILCNCAIGDDGAAIIARSTSLHMLIAVECAIGDAGAAALAHNATLTMLDLTDNLIGDAGASEFARNETLDTLYLAYNAIGDAGASALARNTTLRRLYLFWNQISDAGVDAFAEALEAANACALARAEMCQLKRAVGQHAHGVLERYVRAGNRAMEYVCLTSPHTAAAAAARVKAALRARERWH
jgi:hypothetical protein